MREWKVSDDDNENISIIDLSGLGDSDDKDEEFTRMCEEWVNKADGFLVIIAPPRPAEIGTLRSVEVMLRCGIKSEHVIFGFNKLNQLGYGDDDETVCVDGLLGITDAYHQEVVVSAKQQFLHDLQEGLQSRFPTALFTLGQVVEYDAKSGWNVLKLFEAVVDLLPLQALERAKQAAEKATEALEQERQLKAEEVKSLEEAKKAYEASFVGNWWNRFITWVAGVDAPLAKEVDTILPAHKSFI